MTRRPGRKRALKLGLAVIAGIALGLVATAGYGWWWFQRNILDELPTDLSSFKEYRPLTSVRVLASDDTLVDEFHVERRVWVPLEELPEHVPRAFIAAEDRRFWEHPGIDVTSIARAAFANWQAGGVSQGGSTLTQQLVKNLIVGDERSYERKLKEAVLAYRLEKELGKERVLELYINYVFLGSGNYGVEAAARDYFGVSARDLDAGQAALLAGLVPAPSRYNPRAHPEVARTRRDIVLGILLDLGWVGPDEVAAYREAEVAPAQRGRLDRSVGTAYLTEVRREVRRVLPGQLPYERGFTVHSALDLELQQVAERAVRDTLDAVVRRQGRMPARQHLGRAAMDGFLAAGPGLARDDSGALQAPLAGDCFEAVVPRSGSLKALSAGSWKFGLVPGDQLAPVRRRDASEGGPLLLMQVAQPGDVYMVCLREDGQVQLQTDRPWAEGAAVVMENATGRLLAIVGGYEHALEGFDRAFQARRQPGSSFKPYVYATALKRGRTQIDTIVDGPLSLPAGGGKTWSPKNYGGGFAGATTLRTALANSYNTPAVRLTLELGVPEVIRTAREMGVRTPLRRDPTIALGSSEVTPLDQVIGYATIARLGLRPDPVLIDALVDVDGNAVAAAGETLDAGGVEIELPGGPGERVLPEGVAYELRDMLVEVVRGGTARRAFRADRDRAGKTGTTNDWVDAWFCGFTPRHTIVVWVGSDGTFSLGQGETGGRAALPAWMALAEVLQQEEERFEVPDDGIRVQAAGTTVGLARGHVPRAILPTRAVGPAPLPPFPR